MQRYCSHPGRSGGRCAAATLVAEVRKAPIATALLLFSLLYSPAFAQKAPEVQPDSFLRSNDRFALDLLKVAHEQSQDRNIVLAPLPVSLTFAALLDGTTDSSSTDEIQSAFHWDENQPLASSAAGRMLLARFAKPRSYLNPQSAHPKGFVPPILRRLGPEEPEELWLSAAFLYRGQGSLSPDFMSRVKSDFGFTFRAVGEKTPQSRILASNYDRSLPTPAITGTGKNDFWITSFIHLRTYWAENTFQSAHREKHDFTLQSGKVLQSDFLKSDLESYPYARTDDFEAVELSCLQATILLVLPASGRDIGELEAAMAKDPNMIETLLAPQQGDVQLPPFHLSYETDLKDSLKKMGVRRIFADPRTLLSMAPERDGGILRGVAQKVDITVDEYGIRADAGTVGEGAFGGIFSPRNPFHMVLNRPFLFMVRDPVTNALLFLGVVVNPNLP